MSRFKKENLRRTIYDRKGDGPGFNRMKARLGPDAMEKMRLDVLARQEAAAASVAKPTSPRSDDGPGGYPKPKRRK